MSLNHLTPTYHLPFKQYSEPSEEEEDEIDDNDNDSSSYKNDGVDGDGNSDSEESDGAKVMNYCFFIWIHMYILFHDSTYHNTCPLFQIHKVTFHLSNTLKTGVSKSSQQTNRSAQGKKAEKAIHEKIKQAQTEITT